MYDRKQGLRAVTPARNINKVNFFLDVALALGFAVEMEVHFTGLPLHELIGLFFAVALAIHLILHWDWVVSITRTFFNKLWHDSRLNYVLNVLLLVDVIAVTVTGIVVSETLGLHFGLSPSQQTDWLTVHAFTSHLSLVITALHVALHWRWIATHTAKYLLPKGRPAAQSAKRFTPNAVAQSEGERGQ